MNEKPILFNSEMVNAILSGRKTQTRRIMGNQPAGQDLEAVHVRHNDDFNFQWYGNLGESSYFRCPLGKPGDQLWVRETWARYNIDQTSHDMAYRATAPADWPNDGLWRPSIHMPRWASRINLLITGVRVERLQDISEQDAMAEGITAKEVIIETRYEGGGHVEITAERFFFVGGDDEGYESAEEAFAELWDSIYGQKEGESWQANPWVWVINFERMEAK